MYIQGDDSQTIEFSISGYQFPDAIASAEEFYWDANWLNITLKVHSKICDWQTTDPSLTTTDVGELIRWFENLSKNERVKWGEQGFTEPNIVVRLENSELDEIKHITFCFDYESVPIDQRDNGIEVSCHFSNQQLEELSKNLTIELSKFPKR